MYCDSHGVCCITNDNRYDVFINDICIVVQHAIRVNKVCGSAPSCKWTAVIVLNDICHCSAICVRTYDLSDKGGSY